MKEAYMSNEGKQIYVNELAYDMGFRNGDHIISFDDYCPESFWTLQADLVREMADKATVLRDGDTVVLYMDKNRTGDILNSPGMFDLAVPFTVEKVAEDSPNHEAGLAKGDRIISVDSTEIVFVQDAWPVLKTLAGQIVPITIARAEDTLSIPMQVDTAGRLGVWIEQAQVEHKEYSFLDAIPAGFKKTFSTIGGYLKDLKLVATPSTEAYKSVGSFIAIGQIFPSSWNWQSFLNIIALLSIMLGVMNLIPIPALDGGHILFTLYEMITKRKPSEKFLYVTQIIGMILLLGLTFLAFGNDIARLF